MNKGGKRAGFFNFYYHHLNCPAEQRKMVLNYLSFFFPTFHLLYHLRTAPQSSLEVVSGLG